ncbi:hypothetical protein [Myxosarcina sp. GI1]|uniref:hypothetical protein n=1 Tax=Myxosarcina sp. GI1 TaxID=1541065 RepID=UPI0012E016D2|nr:hypothetical protein [Myxosarcina sp. GI1]
MIAKLAIEFSFIFLMLKYILSINLIFISFVSLPLKAIACPYEMYTIRDGQCIDLSRNNRLKKTQQNPQKTSPYPGLSIENQKITRDFYNKYSPHNFNDSKFYAYGSIINQANQDYFVATLKYLVKDGDRTVTYGYVNIYRTIRSGEKYDFEHFFFENELPDRWNDNIAIKFNFDEVRSEVLP